MNRREFLKTSGLGLAALGFSGHWANAFEKASAGDKPNIIFIFTDDQGIGDVSCYGADKFKTPNIDALAVGGTRFEYCYATPVCGPSRCQFLTGRYPFRTGHNDQNHALPKLGTETMVQNMLKKAGYWTGMAGKWGQVSFSPKEWGYDEFLSHGASGIYYREQYGKKMPPYQEIGQDKEIPEKAYFPDIVNDFAINFIARNKDKPFFLYYPMIQPHKAHQSPDTRPHLPTPDSKPGTTDQKELYNDNIVYMDKLIGKFVAELDRLKLREKTLIVFTSDNGTGKHNAALDTIGGRKISGLKNTMLEGGSRVPLIVNWPGTTPAGEVNHDLTDLTDFFPTFAELAGATLPEKTILDGQSIAPQIKGEKGKPREWVYVELDGESYACDKKFKLTNKDDLFDMKDAPFIETAIPKDSTDADAIAGRKKLQEVLDQHPTLPGGGRATKYKEEIEEAEKQREKTRKMKEEKNKPKEESDKKESP